MTNRLLAIVGGVASALLFLSVAGGTVGAVMVALFAQLPLLLAGLTLGTASALIAGATAAATVAAAVGTGPALDFAIKTALPAFIVAGLALRARADADGSVAWYPPGSILGWLSVAGLAHVAYTVLSGATELPHEAIRQWMEQSMSGMNLPAASQRTDALARFVTRYHPGMLGAMMVFLVSINAVIAQWMASRFGRNIRPTPSYSAIELPFWMEAAALVCLGLSFLPGTMGLAGQNGLIVVIAPFFFVGLAVIHGVSKGWPGRAFALGLVYFVTIVLGWPAVLIVGVGFSESILGLRRRFASGGPDQEEE